MFTFKKFVPMHVINSALRLLEETVVHLWYACNGSFIQHLEVSSAFMMKLLWFVSSQLYSLILNTAAMYNRTRTAQKGSTC